MVNSKRFLRPKKRGGAKGSRKRMRGGTLENPQEGEKDSGEDVVSSTDPPVPNILEPSQTTPSEEGDAVSPNDSPGSDSLETLQATPSEDTQELITLDGWFLGKAKEGQPKKKTFGEKLIDNEFIIKVLNSNGKLIDLSKTDDLYQDILNNPNLYSSCSLKNEKDYFYFKTQSLDGPSPEQQLSTLQEADSTHVISGDNNNLDKAIDSRVIVTGSGQYENLKGTVTGSDLNKKQLLVKLDDVKDTQQFDIADLKTLGVPTVS